MGCHGEGSCNRSVRWSIPGVCRSKSFSWFGAVPSAQSLFTKTATATLRNPLGVEGSKGRTKGGAASKAVRTKASRRGWRGWGSRLRRRDSPESGEDWMEIAEREGHDDAATTRQHVILLVSTEP